MLHTILIKKKVTNKKKEVEKKMKVKEKDNAEQMKIDLEEFYA